MCQMLQTSPIIKHRLDTCSFSDQLQGRGLEIWQLFKHICHFWTVVAGVFWDPYYAYMYYVFVLYSLVTN